MLHVVACCWELLHKAWNGSKFEVNNSQHFFCSVIAKAERNNVASICMLLPTRTRQLPTLLDQNSLITFKACFWQTCLGIMLYWKFRKIKPLLFKIIIILLIIIIYKINISMFNLFQILSSLLVSPYFFLDVLYVHELPSELNLCKVSSIESYHKISKQVFCGVDSFATYAYSCCICLLEFFTVFRLQT